jgi:hypothetical protein
MDNFARENHKPIKIVRHRIGYWSFWPEWQILPHPSEVCNHPWDPDELKIVIEYLKNGTVAVDYGGCAFNRMDHSDELNPRLGSAELTDGYWYWPEGLAYYLEEYKVALPPEFIEHVLRPKQKYTINEQWYFFSSRKWTLWAFKYRKHNGSRWMVRLRYFLFLLIPLAIFFFILSAIFRYVLPKRKKSKGEQLKYLRESGRTINVNDAINAVNENRGHIYCNTEEGIEWWFSAEKKLVNYQNRKRFLENNCLAIDFVEPYDHNTFDKVTNNSIAIGDWLTKLY